MKPRRASGLLLAVLAVLPLAVPAQSARETEKKLGQVRSELKSIAAERRKLEGQRGDAAGPLPCRQSAGHQ